MKTLPDLQAEFDGMMRSMCLENCGTEQRMDMLRAFCGGVLIAAMCREDEALQGHISLFARSAGIV